MYVAIFCKKNLPFLSVNLCSPWVVMNRKRTISIVNEGVPFKSRLDQKVLKYK